MTERPIGWRFPPTGGGQEDGFNHSGMSHFLGDPFVSLARETIQNSLDARLDNKKPVSVAFELSSLEPNEIGGEELQATLRQCLLEATEDGDLKATTALKAAIDSIQGNVRGLRVADRNTTGLDGKKWRALTKSQGESQKAGVEGAGGSHGIGKYAPFAVSDLRTVFYWTHYREGSTTIEKFQGKSVLMSHELEKQTVQGTGFYGIRERCVEVTQDIADKFRSLDRSGLPIQGTSVLIAGFKRVEDWRHRVARSVLENFFHAIGRNSLEVLIEPEEDGTDIIEINSKTIGTQFSDLGSGDELYDGNEDGTTFTRARHYWELLDGSVDPVEKQDQDLGHCRLWIKVGSEEEMPNRVALVRQTGMLITDQQQGLLRFSSHKPFAAMCVFEDPAGNELLQGMENPQHNKFEPDRLPDDRKAVGRRALNRITRWIREEIRKQAGPPEGGRTTILTELSAVLPDTLAEEPFEDTDSGSEGQRKERGFHEALTVRLRPIVRHIPSIPDETDETLEGDGPSGGEDGESGGGPTGENGGQGGTGGSGEGEGEGGTGSGGGGSRGRPLDISAVRILPVPGPGHRYRVGFDSHSTGTAALIFEEAGDSSASHLAGISGESSETLEKVQLVAGQRKYIDIVSEVALTDRAVRVVARESH